MTVFELIGKLSMANPNDEVRIVVSSDSYGATPTVGIHSRGVINGFDFDSGKVLIKTDAKIKKAGKDA